MGALRFVLAMSVLSAHLAFYPSGLPHPLHPDVAVQGFYVVSGFLITLVLHEKYSGSLWLFYSNRALRIFPIYWATLILYLIVDVSVDSGAFSAAPPGLEPYRLPTVTSWIAQNGSALGQNSIISLVLTNTFIFGQDFLAFIRKDSTFSATPDLFYHLFIVIRVAWTLAIELGFYLIAPFVVRRASVVASVMATSLVAQLLCYKFSSLDPGWYSRIFPFALAWFMAGALAYHGYVWLRLRSKERAVKRYAIAATLAVALLTIAYPWLPVARPLYLFGEALCLPGVVLLGRLNPLDKILGDLSYPVYMIHPLFMIVILPTPQVVPVVLSLGLAYLLTVLLEKPLDLYRQSRVSPHPAE
ncbi:acyltransferase [Bradyrhizobium sp.]|uniref:acyltransferase family protein n=1 Tax=Bradyrhizobium sp. TaxID=376 RepID=UPI001DF4F239|nr:acyltransferase [Bradyrhizobium sp.]MBV8697005.1 acyltransferase [Bradyrhizobium sp.]MBV9984806.1 acyltransferase [Bradyrhizobium sp.]